MNGQTIVTVLTLLGAGAVVSQLVKALIDWATGRNGREASAWEQRDAEAKARRVLEEYAHELRLRLQALGVPIHEVPPWPSYDTRGKGRGSAAPSSDAVSK